MITTLQCLEFVRKYHRKLDSWTDAQIVMSIIRGINDKTLIFTTDEKDELNGLCVGYHVDDRTIRISFICAPNNLISFTRFFKKYVDGKKQLVWLSRRKEKKFTYGNLNEINS